MILPRWPSWFKWLTKGAHDFEKGTRRQVYQNDLNDRGRWHWPGGCGEVRIVHHVHRFLLQLTTYDSLSVIALKDGGEHIWHCQLDDVFMKAQQVIHVFSFLEVGDQLEAFSNNDQRSKVSRNVNHHLYTNIPDHSPLLYILRFGWCTPIKFNKDTPK